MNTWSKPLGNFCIEIDDRCGDRELPVFSVSKNLGVLPQAERFKKRIASANTSRYKVAKPGDFVFDPMLLWSGSISRNATQTIGIVSPAYCVFRLVKGLNPCFLHLYLTQRERLPFYDSISFGTNERRRKAQFSAFMRLEIPVPPLAEQERMVKLLDAADELRKLRSQADERTTDLIPALFHEMFGDPLANTKGFPAHKLGDLCNVSRGASPRPINVYMGGTVPWIRIGDGSNTGPYVTSTAEFVTEEGAKKSVFLPPGSLIIANSGVSCGFARILKIGGCIHDGWVALLNLKPDLDAHYLLYFVNQITLDLRARAPSGTQPNLNTALVRSLEIPLPPLPLQLEFANRVAEIRELEAKQAASRERLDALFQSMLHRAFRGEL